MTKNIHQRLNETRKEIDYLRKEKKVEGYMAVTHDQVTREVRKWFVAHGIGVVPSVRAATTVDTGTKTQKGTPIVRFEGIFDVDFVNIDSPEDKVTARVAAHANDHGDKAPGKALSYAVKSAILKVLMIETGESDESRNIDEVSPDDIVGFEEAMEAATTREELQVALSEAMGEAKQCGDRFAAKRFRAFAEKVVSKKFNEFMPAETKPAPSTGETAVAAAGVEERRDEPEIPVEPAAPATPASNKPPKPNPEVKMATAGMMATVKKAMERTSKTEDQLFEKFRFGSAAIPADKINEVIAWARG